MRRGVVCGVCHGWWVVHAGYYGNALDISTLEEVFTANLEGAFLLDTLLWALATCSTPAAPPASPQPLPGGHGARHWWAYLGSSRVGTVCA
jgi:hypothetical protein